MKTHLDKRQKKTNDMKEENKFPDVDLPEIPKTNWSKDEFINALCSPPEEFAKWWNKPRKLNEIFGKLKQENDVQS